MLEFSGMPGLIPNMEKSTVFFKNVKNETKTKILDILPFTVGKLPEDLKDRMEKRDLSNSWDALIDQYARSVCNNSIGSILRRILLATVVYNIWKERNTRLFTGEVKDGKTVQIIITESVKLQLLGLKVKKSTNVDKVASNWNVMMNYK
ncbi:hypothetical protein Tco_0846729 [Tanacetum coccineum]